MKIKQVHIQNFRGISDLTIYPKKNNLLIGANGAGKSSVLMAVRYCLTGAGDASYIKNGADALSVSMEMEDGTITQRIRTRSNTICKLNGKQTTNARLSEFLQNRYQLSGKVFNIISSAKMIKAMDSKDMASFLFELMPITVPLETILSYCNEIAPLGEEETDKITSLFATKKDIGIKEITTAYQDAFDDRRLAKREAKYLLPKTQVEIAPVTHPRAELEAMLEEVMKQEVSFNNYQKDFKNYEAILADRKKALANKERYKNEYRELENITKPRSADLQSIASIIETNEDFIKTNTETLARLKSNIAFDKKALDGLNTSVCPLSPKLVCNTDKSSIKNELQENIDANTKHLDRLEGSINKSKQVVEDNKALLSKLESAMALAEKRENLKKLIDSITIPTLPEKPEKPQGVDFEEEKRKINRELKDLSLHEEKEKNIRLLQEKEHEIQVLETVVKVLEVKSLQNKLLTRALNLFETHCNEQAKKLKQNMAIKFDNANGITIKAQTKLGAGFTDMNSLSSGEKIVVIFLLMDLISSITGNKILMMDSLDKMDAESFSKLAELVKKSGDRFDHTFMATVDHKDLLDRIPFDYEEVLYL